jgi:hypothetical protein
MAPSAGGQAFDNAGHVRLVSDILISLVGSGLITRKTHFDFDK